MSPVIIEIPTSLQVLFIDFIILLRSFFGNPSDITRALAMARGLAPITARSFTVPETANLPISPPGKILDLLYGCQ